MADTTWGLLHAGDKFVTISKDGRARMYQVFDDGIPRAVQTEPRTSNADYYQGPYGYGSQWR